ncbi:BamA/TamA family outer membrane protein [Sphingomicrobium sp. XHP0239]|uniref:autotransporter assembly complex protein TamA n=1 Tax=Sphingomicrobium maritimum TaxID=3133972 RepID=UPI0031CC91AF
MFLPLSFRSSTACRRNGARCGQASLFVLALLLAQPALAQEAPPPSEENVGDIDDTIPPPPPDANLPVTEDPIISDEEFADEVPELADDDPALDMPLESIEEFERRLAAEQADAEPTEGQEAPLGDPALADGDVVEEIGDAPITDPELAAPLPPLETFEVEPVEFAEEASDTEVVEIDYAVRVDGLEEADGQTEIAVIDQFEALSALYDGDGEADNLAQVSARLTEDSLLIQRILAAEGWYGATAETRIDRSETANGQPITAVITVVPGPRYTFADVIIDADPTEPADLIADNLAIQPGEPIVATRVQGAEAQVAIALPEQGYPFAEVGQRDILLDQETGDGVYTLPVTTGPRSSFGGIRTTGNLAFGADHIETLARFERGELYDSREVDDLRQALVATGLFNTVSVVPEQSGELAPDGTQYATILVDQDAGPPRTIAGSAGFSTGEGVRIAGSWTHRNLFPPEGALIANGVLGTREQGAGVTFRRSNWGQRDRSLQFTLEALHSDYEAFEAYTGRLSGLVTYVSTPIWQKTLTYAYGAQLLATNEQDFDVELGERVNDTFFIGGLTGQVGFDLSDDLLNPTEGFRVTALIEPEAALETDFIPYVRGIVDASGYFPAGDALILAARARVGTIQGIERFELAPSRRLYAGGGGSVRGYGYQQLGPKVLEPNPRFDPEDPEDESDPFLIRPIGGRSVIEGALEARYRFGNFGIVGFVDAGQVYEDEFPTFEDIRYGVGVGGRYYTNFGPLRFDVATPIGRRDGESLINVYVSIGQAF